jgi:hypothetical protein
LTRAKGVRVSFLDVLSAVPHFFEGLLAVYEKRSSTLLLRETFDTLPFLN